jgi:hypothetical protein
MNRSSELAGFITATAEISLKQAVPMQPGALTLAEA